MNGTKDTKDSRWVILFIILIVTFMSTLDGSIVNVALPVMSKALNVDTSNIQLVVISYLVVISATILIFGRLGDMFGKKKIFNYGLALFTLGSLLCGLTNSLSILVLARVIQAIGAAGSMANSQGIITEVFPPGERGKALGITGTFVALGSLIGPPLGGFILDISSWQYIFLINVPIGIIVLFYSIKLLPKEDKNVEGTLDGLGAVLFMFAIIPLFVALNYAESLGFNDPKILIGIFISVFSFVAFIKVEKREKHPLLDLEIFKNRLFTVSILCAFISFTAIFCSVIIQPFYLQDIRGFTPSQTGLLLMIYPLVLAVVAPISGHLSDKTGSEILTFVGLLVTSLGLFLMSTLTETSPIILLVIFVATMSLGNGLFQSPNNALVMSEVPRDKLGVAGSVNALIRNLGMVCGIALASILLYDRMSYKVGYKVTNFVAGRSDIFIYGMKIVYITAGFLSLFGAIITFVRVYKGKNNH